MPLPEKLWFTLAECCERLAIGARAFRDYLDAGLFPRGLVPKVHRRKKNKRVWTPEDVEYMVFVIRNQQRFRPRPPRPAPKKDGAK